MLLRTGKESIPFEMFIVSTHTMIKPTVYKIVRKIRFSAKLITDAFTFIKNYGIVLFCMMAKLRRKVHSHGELDAVTSAMKCLKKNPNGKLSTAWKNGFKGILDAYLGAVPEKFSYKGKEYTPKTFATALGLNYDDYISVTSYSHHPFYTRFALEVPDNWRNDLSYNVPVDDMMSISTKQ